MLNQLLLLSTQSCSYYFYTHIHPAFTIIKEFLDTIHFIHKYFNIIYKDNDSKNVIKIPLSHY